MKNKKSSDKINYFLFKIVVVFIFFDGIRSNLRYNEYISQLKELLVLILFFLAVRIKIKGRERIYNIGLILFFTYHFFAGILSFPFLSFSSFTVFYKSFQILMLIYSFYCFYELTKISTGDFFTFIVKTGVCFVLTNTFLYFVELPIWNIYHPWWGRISCGYPTMDVVSLSYTLIILLYFDNLKITPIERIIYVSIIITGIFLQATGSGIVMFVCITCASLFYFILFKSSRLLKRNAKIIGSMSICLFFMVSAVMNRYYPDEYMKIMYLMENKISILLGNEEEYNTLEIREEQYENAMKRNYGIISKVLGCGLSNVTYDAYLAHKGYIFIENQYDLLKICLGYIGFTFYVLFIVIAGTGAILMKRVTNQTKMLFFLSILIFAINSKTLIPLVLFSNTAFFALFYAFFKRVQNDNSFYLANFINK